MGKPIQVIFSTRRVPGRSAQSSTMSDLGDLANLVLRTAMGPMGAIDYRHLRQRAEGAAADMVAHHIHDMINGIAKDLRRGNPR